MLLLMLACFASGVSARKPNVIVIMTDDQDSTLNSMTALKYVNNLIASKGVTLTNSFVNTPLCCPSRSTILTGKYLHNTGVRNNSLSGNCSSPEWQKVHEPFSIASLLKNQANYTTFYAGKYLNQYGSKRCGGTKHVPSGYDWWIGLKGNSKYYNYTLSINGTARRFATDYLTDLMKTYALDFLNQRSVQVQPFFMMLSTPAPHAPFTPAPRHKNAFPSVHALRTPSFNYSHNDKHWLVRMPPEYLPDDITILDILQRRRLQTLLAVDEMVQTVIVKLNELGILKNTYIIFTSDNGYHIGQFAQPWDKRQPYETDIRVPLLIRGPGIKRNTSVDFPVSSVDLAPTILDMAGVKSRDLDGQSFLDYITNFEAYDGVRNIFVEYFGEGSNNVDPRCPWTHDHNLSECSPASWCKCHDSRNNTYVCLRRFSRGDNIKYCEFHDDQSFREFYDLDVDPFELKNRANLEENLLYKNILESFKSCRGIQCQILSRHQASNSMSNVKSSGSSFSVALPLLLLTIAPNLTL